MKQKILLDTDIGTDIDDAVCLAYLLMHPDCDLLGITTVTGQPELRAQLASAICRHAKRDIPIFPGVEQPITVPLQQKVAEQASALGRWDHQTHFPSGSAVEFLRTTIRQNPGEITLLTIAPLTNIGLLFAIDPEVPLLLKGLVMMCGRFRDPIPPGYLAREWNAAGDPHASHIVYRSRPPLHRSLGLDVTHRVMLSAGEFRKTYAGVPIMEPVLEFAEIWFRHIPSSTYHDPLAAATIFEPDLCSWARGSVEIPLDGADRSGMTLWTDDPLGPHEIAVTVDADAYFRHANAVLSGKGPS